MKKIAVERRANPAVPLAGVANAICWIRGHHDWRRKTLSRQCRTCGRIEL